MPRYLVILLSLALAFAIGYMSGMVRTSADLPHCQEDELVLWDYSRCIHIDQVPYITTH